MLFFLRISALKILAVATVTPAYRYGGVKILRLDLQKNNGHYNLTFYLDRALATFIFDKSMMLIRLVKSV
jgi:hypothetical protein